MAAFGQYDATLQMFLEEAGPIDMDRLHFLRWLVETGRLMDDTKPDYEEVLN